MPNIFELDRANKMYHGDKDVLAIMKGSEELRPKFFNINNRVVFYTPYTSDGLDKISGGRKAVADNTLGGAFQGITYPHGFNVQNAMSGTALTVNVWIKVNNTNWRTSLLQLMKLTFWHDTALNFYHDSSNFAYNVECNHGGTYYSSGRKKHNMNDGRRHMYTVIQTTNNVSFFIDGEPFRSRTYAARKTNGAFHLIAGNSPVCEFSQLYAAKTQWTNSEVKRVYDAMKDYYNA